VKKRRNILGRWREGGTLSPWRNSEFKKKREAIMETEKEN